MFTKSRFRKSVERALYYGTMPLGRLQNDFADHDLDQDFLSGHHDHLTDKGWLYFDKALDDFAHDRPL
jgi:hypothetical protein